MARIAGVDLPKNKKIRYSLSYIYGIGDVQSVNTVSYTHLTLPTICSV